MNGEPVSQEIKYKARIDLSVKNNAHTIAFNFINDHANGRQLKILEIGCSTGYFGSFLKEYKHEVHGVELNVQAAIEAKKCLDQVYIGDINSFFSVNDTEFDVITFGDVLEHLPDPGSILSAAKKHLSQDGIVVASIPNVAHNAIRAMLLEGRWDYSELGILDKTHLRFFTLKTIVDLFSQESYQITAIAPVQLSIEQVDMICQLNIHSETIKKIETCCHDNRGQDFQYVLIAQPTNNRSLIVKNKRFCNPSIKVVCMVATVDSSLVDIRLRTPLLKWASIFGGELRIINIIDQTQEDLSWGDIFIFQRESNKYIEGLMRYLKHNNKKLIFEIDDNLLSLPEFLSHHIPAINPDYLINSIKNCDLVTVSTDELCYQLSGLNKNIRVIPNCPSELSVNSVVHSHCNTDQVTILVVSSDKILLDFIVPALKQAQAELKVKLIGIGPPGEYLAKNGIITEIHRNMPYPIFRKFISSLTNPIGLIPLDNSVFSSCKSPIKFFDFSMSGIPCICSNVKPYSSHIINLETGILVGSNTEEIFSAIKLLAEDFEKRQKLAQAAKIYVQSNYNLSISADIWNDSFYDLLQSKILLNQHIYKLNTKITFTERGIWLLRKLAKPSAYRKALKTLKNQGVKGLYRLFVYNLGSM